VVLRYGFARFDLVNCIFGQCCELSFGLSCYFRVLVDPLDVVLEHSYNTRYVFKQRCLRALGSNVYSYISRITLRGYRYRTPPLTREDIIEAAAHIGENLEEEGAEKGSQNNQHTQGAPPRRRSPPSQTLFNK
jgi:hypothetical protein